MLVEIRRKKDEAGGSGSGQAGFKIGSNRNN